MNPIVIGMDVLLAGLLLAALVMGMRLNGRLKALRESHAGFAKAVSELDAAASKADAALKSLHAASDDAHDSLLARIETARALALKLEKASETADAAARRAEDAAAKAPILAPAGAAAPSAPRRSLGELLAGRAAPARVFEPELAVAAPASQSPAISPLLSAATSPRRRPTADEDLFAAAEDAPPPALSGLMRMSLARSSERGGR